MTPQWLSPLDPRWRHWAENRFLTSGFWAQCRQPGPWLSWGSCGQVCPLRYRVFPKKLLFVIIFGHPVKGLLIKDLAVVEAECQGPCKSLHRDHVSTCVSVCQSIWIFTSRAGDSFKIAALFCSPCSASRKKTSKKKLLQKYLRHTTGGSAVISHLSLPISCRN